MTTAPSKTYLGDGAYAAIDRTEGALILTTEDGINITNRIVLEPEVLRALLNYLAACGVRRVRPY